MFEGLNKYRAILVTGPQRSGTRICSKMIAHDTGYEWLQEGDVGATFISAKSFLSKNGVVVHGPMLSSVADLFDDDVLVVFMRRDIADIVASQDRILWSGPGNGEGWERKQYDAMDIDMPISEVKYFIWDHLQRGRIKHTMDIPYESLKRHPFWVQKHLRKNFEANQTE
jgi:hypothetical protein